MIQVGGHFNPCKIQIKRSGGVGGGGGGSPPMMLFAEVMI